MIRHAAEAYPGVDGLVRAIVGSAARQLRGPIERVGTQIRQMFTRLSPEISYHPVDQS